jgi:hypothetical protein
MVELQDPVVDSTFANQATAALDAKGFPSSVRPNDALLGSFDGRGNGEGT